MTDTQTRRIWVAHGPSGAVGIIRKEDGEYTVVMAGKDEKVGSYPSMEIAKNALHSHLTPGSDWPEFREH